MTDWTAIVGAVTTLLGGLGGYWLAGRNEESRDERRAIREAAARRDGLAERLEEDRHNFQRDTLLELQDELQRFARVTTRIATQDEKTLKELGQLYQLPPGLSDEEIEIRVSVLRLRERVLDPELRQLVSNFIDLSARSSVGLGKKPADEAIEIISRREAESLQLYIKLTELLGAHLRRELDRRFLVVPPDDQRG